MFYWLIRGAFMKFSVSLAIVLSFASITTIRGQVVLEANVGQRIENLKRIIDFFHSLSSSSDFKALRPRHITFYKGTNSKLRDIRNHGYIPVGSFHDEKSISDIRNYVREAKDDGVNHYVIWTEPNRTWPQQDKWLEGSSWQNFIDYSVRMHDAAREADPNCLLSGPCLTTDPRDEHVWDRLLEFLQHWAQEGKKLDYVNMHPPFEPDHVTRFSNYARGFANATDLGIKGISIGEYPYYLDDLAVHVRYFVAFEEAFNCVFAAKSNYKDNCCNSGLLDGSGRKRPVYWLFHTYARMTGERIFTTKAGGNNHVQALASYDKNERKLHMLVGCYGGIDDGKDEEVMVLLKNVTGSAKLQIYSFHSDGLDKEEERTITVSNDILGVPLGTVAAGDARYVTLDFTSDQTRIAETAAPLRVYRPATVHKSLSISGRPGSALPRGQSISAFSATGRLLWRSRGARSPANANTGIPADAASGALFMRNGYRSH